jgi:regulator of protease activity HflC (stomatin/prohibitin superfamily)
LENAILNMVMTQIRTVMGSMELDHLLSQRDEINHKLLATVDQAAQGWGVKMTRIEIKDINPPRDLVESMGRQMKAERDKRANILEAEGMRGAAILKAEGEKQSIMLQAEGRKEAAFREAEARERSAEAEAKATQVVSDAIAGGNVQAINYFVANNYIKALEALAQSPNQKILMMPLDATSILGSIGGIAEIAKEAFGTGAGGQAASSTKRAPTVPPISRS